VVVRRHDGNEAPRRKIILHKVVPEDWSGPVLLSRNVSNVRVFDAAEDGTEITFSGDDNIFANEDLPKDLWVQGELPSSSMRDVELTLSAQQVPECRDAVRFTVLWVTVTTKHSGTLAPDNSARALYSALVVPPPDYSLGHHLFCTTFLYIFEDTVCWNGRGTEIAGPVSPVDFVPAQFSTDPHVLHIARAVTNGNAFWGPEGKENVMSIPPGPDTSDEDRRDDDPQSGGSTGVIYDLDMPGVDAFWIQPANTIVRYRVNFESWAEYEGTRCSAKVRWFTRQSYRKTGPFDAGRATGGTENTLTDSSKDWTVGFWVPGAIKIQSGTGAKQVARIVENTQTTVTIEGVWEPGKEPDESSIYHLINTSTWTLIDDVEGDNVSADGSTNITWNLE